MMLQGHKNAILDLRWTADGENLQTPPRQDGAMVGTHVGEQVKQMKDTPVSSTRAMRPDGRAARRLRRRRRHRARVDLRAKGAVAIFRTKLPATAVAFSADAPGVFVGGLDNHLKMFDYPRRRGRRRRRAGPVHDLRGHTDTITGVARSPGWHARADERHGRTFGDGTLGRFARGGQVRRARSSGTSITLKRRYCDARGAQTGNG